VISLILTVLNEGESIRPLLDSIAAQTRPPDEIVIVDGGSRDATVEVLRSYAARLPLRVIEQPGANISQGRNHAIAAAQGDVIAVTDAGVVLAPGWLAALLEPLERDPGISVAAGFFKADARTPFELALGAATLPLADEISGASFLPSSRSIAFRRGAWALVGGYPEWLDYCEDLIFDLRMKAFGLQFAFVPDAIAYFRPRPTLRAFLTQYYRYARGDGKADLWRARHLVRYLTYGVGLPLLLVLLGRRGWRIAAAFALVGGGLAYLRRPLWRLPVLLAESDHILPDSGGYLRALALIPLVRALGDVAKMLGYPAGLLWRRANRPPRWRM
jgi:glycosyltransferase involved in cell wall biosynthesis